MSNEPELVTHYRHCISVIEGLLEGSSTAPLADLAGRSFAEMSPRELLFLRGVCKAALWLHEHDRPGRFKSKAEWEEHCKLALDSLNPGVVA